MNESQSSGTETDNNEDIKTPSDARIILGPLVKYAGIGLVMVAIIITTVVTLDRQFNDIDREVAELEAQLAAANPTVDSDESAAHESGPQTDAVDETPAAQAADSEPASSQVIEASAHQVTPTGAENSRTQAPAVVDATVSSTATRLVNNEAVDHVVSADKTAVVEQMNQNVDSVARPDDFFDRSIEDMIKERNAYLNERDKVYLEEFKANQEKQLQLMRERLARQEQRIEEMEKRNQERYETRAADVMEMQQRRENFLSDRI
jgi:hypothetical protein